MKEHNDSSLSLTPWKRPEVVRTLDTCRKSPHTVLPAPRDRQGTLFSTHKKWLVQNLEWKIFEDNHKCQPMILGTNSTPTGIPNSGCSEEEGYSEQNSTIVIQHSCEAALEPVPFPRQLCSSMVCFALLHCALVALFCDSVLVGADLVYFALFPQDILSVLAHSGRCRLQSSVQSESISQSQQGAGLYE